MPKHPNEIKSYFVYAEGKLDPPFPLPVPDQLPLPNPSIILGYVGNTLLVNGKLWPFLNVEPRKYRFRILNGSNRRSYVLRLSNNEKINQIGTDVGKVTKIIMHWKEHVGDYIWHCHLLEHEDHDMMRPIRVIEDAHPVQPPHIDEH